ncbi:MAG: hypothetical protein HC875_10575 [Anaerolineales bacterium]|nr:hypothetical protein [Anaerolineales bacterium]
MYYLNDEEKKRLAEGIRAAFAVPFIDDVEDFIWEAIFAYAKGIETTDPLNNIRSKRLFDVIDKEHKIGWSVKAAQRTITFLAIMKLSFNAQTFSKKQKVWDLSFFPLIRLQQTSALLF